MSVQNGENKRQHKEERRQISREFDENVRRLRSEDILRDPTAKGSSKAFAFGTLHQDHKDHNDGNDRPDGQ